MSNPHVPTSYFDVAFPQGYLDPPCYESSVDANDLFASLDGRLFDIRGRLTEIEVYSVFDRAGARWVQLALKSRSAQVITLKVGLDVEADAVVGLLICRLEEPADAPMVAAW